ncbi:MAG TPA: hypothetical protein VF815_11695 [Myxococcaceae bacterium]|jgi:hypothetical protein
MIRGSLGLWGTVLVAGTALAQEPPAEVRGLREMVGAVSSVDVRQRKLMLAEGRERVELHVDAGTTIFLPGGMGRLEDLSPGQRLRVAYEPGEHGAVAQWIELLEK